MENRKNAFIIIAVIFFIFGAKYLQPYELEIKEYGFIGIALIIVTLSICSAVAEYCVHKIYLLFKGFSAKDKS